MNSITARQLMDQELRNQAAMAAAFRWRWHLVEKYRREKRPFLGYHHNELLDLMLPVVEGKSRIPRVKRQA